MLADVFDIYMFFSNEEGNQNTNVRLYGAFIVSHCNFRDRSFPRRSFPRRSFPRRSFRRVIFPARSFPRRSFPR